MSFNLTGKTALVTGGSRGIGAAIAKRLASDGAKVALTYATNQEAAETVVEAITVNGGAAIAFKSDASDPADNANAVQKTVDRFGKLDIYVANAGVSEMAPIEQSDFEMHRRQFSVNVDGVFSGVRAAIDHMNDGGSIIATSSVLGHSMPLQGGAMYGASKAAVSAMVRGWARDLGARNIRVNAIQAGPIDTDMNPGDGPFAPHIIPLTALGRYGNANEIASAAAFLASDEASYITGAGIDVDGGMAI